MRIAISGKMASGKSLVAKYLVAKYDFTGLSFAAKLKEICAVLFPRAKYEKDRWLLQQVGQTMREFDPQVWIRFVLPDIKPGKDIVISDVRYPNEYNILRQYGFVMVRMYASYKARLGYIEKAYPDLPLLLLDSYDEVALDRYPFNYTINNDKDVPLGEVYRQVDNMVLNLRIIQ